MKIKQPPLFGKAELVETTVVDEVAGGPDVVELLEQQVDGRRSGRWQQLDFIVVESEGLVIEDIVHVRLSDHIALVIGHIVAVR